MTDEQELAARMWAHEKVSFLSLIAPLVARVGASLAAKGLTRAVVAKGAKSVAKKVAVNTAVNAGTNVAARAVNSGNRAMGGKTAIAALLSAQLAKQSSVAGAIGAGLGRTAAFAWKHPKSTAAVVGAGTLATKGLRGARGVVRDATRAAHQERIAPNPRNTIA